MSEKSLEQQIAEGARVRAFLADPAVQEAFQRLNDRCFEEFKSSTTPAQREAIHAKLQAVDSLKIELSATDGRGTMAENAKRIEERAASRRK
jgi:hypothetical protein